MFDLNPAQKIVINIYIFNIALWSYKIFAHNSTLSKSDSFYTYTGLQNWHSILIQRYMTTDNNIGYLISGVEHYL